MDQEVARGSAACVLAVFLAAVPAAAAAQACLASEGPVGLVAVDAGRELTLADGRRARLAFVEVPDGYGEAARSRLAARIGEKVQLAPVAAAPDRWGRIAAAIFVTQDNAEQLDLGEDLVRSGLARMNPEPADAASCLAALASAEGQARRAGTGLWGDPRHELRQARDTAGLLAASGTFAVFEGRVLSVGERAARTYINFGRRWSEDTTVTIPKRTWRMMVKRGVSAEGLRGRRVRVRGIVEDRGGPLVEVALPEQFELIGTDQAR